MPENIVLTGAQIVTLEKKAHDDGASGEIETAYPGYPGSQDTFCMGNLKGVGRICQQTFVDRYSKVAHCRLYTSKTPITAAGLLNDSVLPFYEAQGLPMLRILTDRRTEYCSKVAQHYYQLYLAINDIDPTKTEAMSAQTNGICECFHKTILQDFYQLTFHRKLYEDLAIRTAGCGMTIMSELIREKCAAGVRHWPRNVLATGLGRKASEPDVI